MSENQDPIQYPISVVRFGIGKELRLYNDELVTTGSEEEKELHIQLKAIKRLTLMPGDPNPSKLILMADLDDDTTIIIAEGMSNAHISLNSIPTFNLTHLTCLSSYDRPSTPDVLGR